MYKDSFVVSKKISFLVPERTRTKEYVSQTLRKDLSGIDDEYLLLLCIGYSVINKFICSFSKGDHRAKHVSLRNITSVRQIFGLTL